MHRNSPLHTVDNTGELEEYWPDSSYPVDDEKPDMDLIEKSCKVIFAELLDELEDCMESYIDGTLENAEGWQQKGWLKSVVSPWLKTKHLMKPIHADRCEKFLEDMARIEEQMKGNFIFKVSAIFNLLTELDKEMESRNSIVLKGHIKKILGIYSIRYKKCIQSLKNYHDRLSKFSEKVQNQYKEDQIKMVSLEYLRILEELKPYGDIFERWCSEEEINLKKKCNS